MSKNCGSCVYMTVGMSLRGRGNICIAAATTTDRKTNTPVWPATLPSKTCDNFVIKPLKIR